MSDFAIRLPSDPSSARAARVFTDESLASTGFAGDRSVVALLTSELVTNAIRHVGGDIDLSMQVERGDVTVHVNDRDQHHWPTVGAAHQGPGGGRGMAVVNALCTTWGVEPMPGQGKSVWFTVAGPN
jgi:anti-sigma regulatory factor (Ser/Thr protein kinase)